MVRNVLVNGLLFLSLGLDTFAVALALGVGGPDRQRRIRLGVIFALAEGSMPLLGFLLGQEIARAAGDAASYVAIALLAGAGIYAIRESAEDEHGEAVASDRRAAGSIWKLAVLALSVSLDELAVGFSLGLLRVPIILAVSYIAVQAMVVTMIGTALGARIGARIGERAGLISGIALIGVAAFLVAEKLV